MSQIVTESVSSTVDLKTDLLRVVDLQKRFPVQGLKTSPKTRLPLPFGPTQKSYLHAVDRINLSIASGESVGLVGESGCGKSTLVRLINRLLDPSDGQIWFEGHEIGQIPSRGFTRHPLRAGMQMVFQDPTDSLNPGFTAFATIADPLRRLGQLPDQTTLRSRIEELADLVGLPQELLSRYPHQLSGGQKARVGIARAIALHPQLLILDEPTSALDVSVQAIILQLLADLRSRLGMSYLFISHDLNVVRLLCNRIYVMYLGKIIETGTVDQIFSSPQHPYTEALIATIPGQTITDHEQYALKGEPRSPIDPDPNICRLYGRCPRAEERCHQEMPILAELDQDHHVACHFPG